MGEQVEVWGERCPQRGHRSSTPLPTYFTLGISFIWMFIISFIISFCNKPVHVVNCFPEFCKLLEQINQASWGGCGNPLVEAQVTIWICSSPLRWGTGTELLACGIGPPLQVDIVRIKLYDTQLVSWRTAWCQQKPPHTWWPEVKRAVWAVKETGKKHRVGKKRFFPTQQVEQTELL